MNDDHVDYARLRSSESVAGPMLRFMATNFNEGFTRTALHEALGPRYLLITQAVDWLRESGLVYDFWAEEPPATPKSPLRLYKITELGKYVASQLDT